MNSQSNPAMPRTLALIDAMYSPARKERDLRITDMTRAMILVQDGVATVESLKITPEMMKQVCADVLWIKAADKSVEIEFAYKPIAWPFHTEVLHWCEEYLVPVAA